MTKRSYDEPHGSASKKAKNDHGQRRKHSKPQHQNIYNSSQPEGPRQAVDYERAVEQLPLSTAPRAFVPNYTPFTVATTPPPLPLISDAKLAAACFVHKSATHSYDRTSAANDLTYERLEFIGDAYLELFATRLIFHHFPALPTGAQSQLRELLVKNETLAEYSRAYGFEQRIKAEGVEGMEEEGRGRGNKGLNKVLGDVFEAYVAGVVLSDQDNGFAVAEKWLTGLWAPKVLEAARSQRYTNSSLNLQKDAAADQRTTYNPTAKAELQKRIMGNDIKLSYEPYKASIELKGDQLGQNRHFIAIFLTGWGYERKLLGKGEGKNKVEAGNWAATDAMYGESKRTVEECEGKLKEVKEKRRKEKEEKEAKAAKAA